MELTFGNWRATANTDRTREGLARGGLAPREAQHLLGLAAGLTQKEIARQFGVSPRTVSHSVERIYHRLGVSRATGAVAEALRRGWIAPLVLLLALMIADLHGEAMRIRQPVRTRQQVTATSRVARRDLGSLYA